MSSDTQIIDRYAKCPHPIGS